MSGFGREQRVIWIAATIALLASPGAAQAPEFTGGPVPAWEKSALSGGSQAVSTLYHAAVCFWEFHRDGATAFLNSERGSKEEAAALNALVKANNDAIRQQKDHLVCFIDRRPSQANVYKGTFRFGSPGLMRGAIAEAAYNRRQIRPRGPEALSLASTQTEEERRWPGVTTAERRESLGRWTALCAAHRAPRLVHRVVAEAPASIGETRALKALDPVLRACLPEGRALLVQRLTMRTLLAEGLWRASRTHRDRFINA